MVYAHIHLIKVTAVECLLFEGTRQFHHMKYRNLLKNMLCISKYAIPRLELRLGGAAPRSFFGPVSQNYFCLTLYSSTANGMYSALIEYCSKAGGNGTTTSFRVQGLFEFKCFWL
jgi:hypothetical protein